MLRVRAGIFAVAISSSVLGRAFHASVSARELEAGDAGLQAAGGAVQLLDGLVRLPQRLGGLLRGLAQLRQRLADLLGAGGLGVHAFIDRLEPRRERLDLLDDLRQMRADLPDFLHPAADFFGKLVHPHDAGRRPPTASP